MSLSFAVDRLHEGPLGRKTQAGGVRRGEQQMQVALVERLGRPVDRR